MYCQFLANSVDLDQTAPREEADVKACADLTYKQEQSLRRQVHPRFVSARESSIHWEESKSWDLPCRDFPNKDSISLEMDIEKQQSPLLSRIGSNVASCFAAVLYGTCSVSIAFINKYLMTTLEFDYPVFIMIVQMMFTIIALDILSLFGVIEMPKFTLERGKMFALPALFYGLNSVLALSALSHMNIALYGVLKRCVPMVTMILSVIILKKGWPSMQTMGSVIFLTIGCIIAGYGDLTFNILGYACGILSNLTQSVYLLLVQRATNGKLSTVESLQLNSINTIPLLIVICIVKGEIWEVKSYDKFTETIFIVVFVLAIFLGCLLNYSLFLCTSLTSALTTSVVGGLKALAQTILGLFTFGGVSHNIATYLGISMSVSGGLSYIFAKYLENRERHTVDLRKIMSFSTAEDLRAMKNDTANGVANGVSNGFTDVHRHMK